MVVLCVLGVGGRGGQGAGARQEEATATGRRGGTTAQGTAGAVSEINMEEPNKRVKNERWKRKDNREEPGR